MRATETMISPVCHRVACCLTKALRTAASFCCWLRGSGDAASNNCFILPVGPEPRFFVPLDPTSGIAWTTYLYEKAVFVFTFPLRINREALKQSESYSFSADEISLYRKPSKTPPSDNDFDNSQTDKLEIVTISGTIKSNMVEIEVLR